VSKNRAAAGTQRHYNKAENMPLFYHEYAATLMTKLKG